MACATLEDGIPTGGSPGVEGVMAEAPLEVATAPSFFTRLVNVNSHRPRMLDRLLPSTYVPPHEWVHPSADIVAPSPEGVWEIIDHWSPFNKRESLVAHMRDLYPTLLQVLTAARDEQYSISFPGYLDRETFQHVAEDGMLICNHKFHKSVELVSFDI